MKFWFCEIHLPCSVTGVMSLAFRPQRSCFTHSFAFENLVRGMDIHSHLVHGSIAIALLKQDMMTASQRFQLSRLRTVVTATQCEVMFRQCVFVIRGTRLKMGDVIKPTALATGSSLSAVWNKPRIQKYTQRRPERNWLSMVYLTTLTVDDCIQ